MVKLAHRPRLSVGTILALGVVLCGLMACDVGILPSAGSIATPCPGNCPPPGRSAAKPHSYTGTHFRLTYFDPWSLDSSDAHHVVLVAQTNLGQISIEVASTSVASGATGSQLVATTAQHVLNPDQYAGVQDTGPILGAEIGYIAGAGEKYQAQTADPNAPTTPVYLEVMASVHNRIGLTFVALSPLDPASQDPSVVPNQSYDLLVNSVEWI